ncbi:MAG: hypothetical protein HQM06_14025 [Magnetococcales bacterium]|nr:hypothetical protein [Magnetococcales bacterium]
MPLRSKWLLLCALSLAAGVGVGSLDTGATPADLLWHARVNQKAMDEALAAGVLQITENGTVALARFVAAPVSSGYERVKNHREKQKQQAEIAGQNQAPAPVPDSIAPSPPEPMPEPITTTSEAAIVPPPPSPPEPTILDASVILPDDLLPAEIRSIGMIVGDLPVEDQQNVIDELAANIEDGSIRTSKLGLLRTFAGLARAGTFVPEKGIMIAARRAAVARRVDQVQTCQKIVRYEPVDVQALITATARKDKGLADVFARMKEALNASAA